MAITIPEEEKKFNSAYQSQYKDQIQGLYDQIAGRNDFSYDVNSDAMYQQLKDQYVQGGKMAMMDTMGQAQAMTGGYGNSYAQSVGQQAYQGYLQGLNEQVPNLYQMALNRYIQQGDQLLDQYSMLTAKDAQDYSRWAADRDFEYGKYLDDLNYKYQLEERDYGRQKDQQNLALNQVQAMIDKGIRPSDELLAQTGLRQENLDAMLKKNVSAGGSGNYGGPDTDPDTDPKEDPITYEWALEHAKYLLDTRDRKTAMQFLNDTGLSESDRTKILREINKSASPNVNKGNTNKNTFNVLY